MQTFDYQAYDAYCADQQYRILDICDSCQGEGHHGIDDVGCLYVCYACGGDGNYFSQKVAK